MTSRIGRLPINIPAGVEITFNADELVVKGSKATLKRKLHSAVKVNMADKVLTVATVDHAPNADAHAGTARALVYNMVHGVSKGYEKKLLLVGVGYRASVAGKVLNLALGFSHPVTFAIPEGITIETPVQTEVIIKGADKQMVGQVAANIRAIRPPEPYKGKGVRYADEAVILKEVKKK